jgi:hypothetical protein
MYPLFDVFTGFKNEDMGTVVEIRILVEGRVVIRLRSSG